MAIEITSDSIVKILVRRGTDSERQLTTLTEGELGYCIDTQRLFIGDGITQGGVVAGNKFLGFVGSSSNYSSIAQNGDLVYQTAGNSPETLLSYNKTSNSWSNLHPQPFAGSISNNFPCLEKDPVTGKWRVARGFVDIGGDTAPSGLTIRYENDETEPALNSITKYYNRLDFDSRFLSLCAVLTPNLSSSFYFGNFNAKTVTNNREATVNVENSFFIDGIQSNPYQIKMYAQDPRDSQASTIESISGRFDIKGNNNISLYSKNRLGYQLKYNTGTSTLQTIFSSLPGTGSYGIPNFEFIGKSVFQDKTYFAPNADVTIYGNLSVFGDATYIDTTVTTTSALSIVNNNDNTVALFVEQAQIIPDDKAVAIFKDGGWPNNPLLAIKDGPFIGINAPETGANSSWSTNGNINFNVFGSTKFSNNIQGTGTSFTVHNSNLYLGLNGTTQNIVCYASNNMYFSTPNLYVTGDITAYYSSDITLKTNIDPIHNALDKVNKIRGITFDWNDKAEKYGKYGREAGVIAQEIEEVLPEAVTTREDGTKAVKYEKLVPLLIEAIKELDMKYGSR